MLKYLNVFSTLNLLMQLIIEFFTLQITWRNLTLMFVTLWNRLGVCFSCYLLKYVVIRVWNTFIFATILSHFVTNSFISVDFQQMNLTRWPPTTSILVVIGRIYRYQFKCSYLKSQKHFLIFYSIFGIYIKF